MTAIESFIRCATDAGTSAALHLESEFGTVQPVIPKGEDPDQINVFFSRIGGSIITALGRRRVRRVELQWTVVGLVWQDCNTVNEAIIQELFERRGVADEAGISAPEDDVFPAEGMTPIFAITTSATLREANW